LDIRPETFGNLGPQGAKFGAWRLAYESQKPAIGGLFSGLQSQFPESQTAWLGREDSNLRMVESKSGRTFNKINAHSEKLQKFTSISLNKLVSDSERQMRSTATVQRSLGIPHVG
jgi:hypothetical protein